jgi:DNA segregation ATPase FtsK/SpoIIIE, S-DNA-T family
MSNKGNTFKNSNNGGSTKRAPRSVGNVTYNKKEHFKSFEKINFSEGQRKALKILGIFLLFVSFVLAVSFVSYLFTWKQDQSYIAETNGGWSTLFQTTEEIADERIDLPVVENWANLGRSSPISLFMSGLVWLPSFLRLCPSS